MLAFTLNEHEKRVPVEFVLREKPLYAKLVSSWHALPTGITVYSVLDIAVFVFLLFYDIQEIGK